MHFIVFDTEFTSWRGCQENGWNDWQKKELVQIAAIKVDSKTLDVVDTLNLYIKPKFNPVLSDYFINLTKITNEIINEKGTDFESAYKMFCEFSKGLTCFSHGWGLEFENIADGKIINENLVLNNVSGDTNLNYKNIAAWFKKMYEISNIDIRSQASGDIARLLGVEDEIKKTGLDIHNASYDAYSILEGIKFFNADGLL